MLMNQIEYAQHRKISRTRIAQYIADGLLPVSALKRIRVWLNQGVGVGSVNPQGTVLHCQKRFLIDVGRADQALAHNLAPQEPGGGQELTESEDLETKELDDFLSDDSLSDDFFQD